MYFTVHHSQLILATTSQVFNIICYVQGCNIEHRYNNNSQLKNNNNIKNIHNKLKCKNINKNSKILW